MTPPCLTLEEPFGCCAALEGLAPWGKAACQREMHDKACPEDGDNYAPNAGLVKEFIISDEFFEGRFPLLGRRFYALARAPPIVSGARFSPAIG